MASGSADVGFLTSASANGKSTSWALPDGASIEDTAVLAERLVSLHEEVDLALVSAGILLPNDLQRFTEMLSRLVEVRVATSDFSSIRREGWYA